MRTNHSAPNRLSDYERTYNNAIDIVTEAVAWAEKVSTQAVAAIVLKPTKYLLFVKGMEVIMNREIKPEEELTFHGIKILKGSPAQFDSVKFEYYEQSVNANLLQ